MRHDELDSALILLGELLEERGESAELLVIGGGALLLHGLSSRATIDLDVLARRNATRWAQSQPLPPFLVQAAADVSKLKNLGATKQPWLNAGPSGLFRMGLPDGWETRLTPKTYGPLILQLLSREDLIPLKLWAATDLLTPERRPRDVGDLRLLQPSVNEWRAAVHWCMKQDGTPDFLKYSPMLDIVRELAPEITLSDLGAG